MHRKLCSLYQPLSRTLCGHPDWTAVRFRTETLDSLIPPYRRLREEITFYSFTSASTSCRLFPDDCQRNHSDHGAVHRLARYSTTISNYDRRVEASAASWNRSGFEWNTKSKQTHSGPAEWYRVAFTNDWLLSPHVAL